MKYATLLVAALLLATPALGQTPKTTCTVGLGGSNINLFGQSGGAIKAPTISPYFDCENPDGYFVAGAGFVTTHGLWAYEHDEFFGKRWKSGPLDAELRMANYHVELGNGWLGIANARATVGYTIPLRSGFSLRPYFILDDQYAWHGFGGARNVVDTALGVGLSWKATPAVTLSVTAESWKPWQKGFLENLKPNFKIGPALRVELPDRWAATASYTAMTVNNFDATDHKTYHAVTVGLSKSFDMPF